MMKTDMNALENCAEDWESGKYGKDPAHVRKVSSERQAEIEKALGLKMISIRLPNNLI